MGVPNQSVEFRTVDAQSANYGFTYNTTNPLFPVFTPVTQANFETPTNYRLQQHRDALTATEEKTSQARFNLAYDNDAGLKAKFGAEARNSERDFLNSQVNYTAPAATFLYTLDEVDAPGPTPSIAGQYRIPLRIGAKQAATFFQANRSRFTVTTAAPTGNYSVEEKVYAGYGQASYVFDDFTLLGGLRYERTEVSSKAVRTQGAVLTPVNNSGSYDNWMPSLHLQWKPTSDIVVRAAWTNTIGRPDYGSMAASETLSFNGAQAVLSRGNPNLKARESRGFDLSLEYYPQDGMISAAVFSKEIDNEIFSLQSSQQLNVGRGLETVLITTPTNAESAKLKGLELAVQQAFTFLPAPFDGFGVNANVTLIDSTFTFLTSTGKRSRSLFQQPEITSNESIYYQRGPFEVRVSHNYIGGQLETIVDANANSDQFWKGRHSFDANVSWRPVEHVTLFLEGQNLSNTGRQEVTGPGRKYLQEWANYGRTYWVGAAVSF